MKKNILLSLALCAVSALAAQAKQVFDITLANSDKYTDCTIVYESSSDTKFRGKDPSGKEVTKTVKSSDILLRKLVEKPKAEEQPKSEPAQLATPAPNETAESSAGDAEPNDDAGEEEELTTRPASYDPTKDKDAPKPAQTEQVNPSGPATAAIESSKEGAKAIEELDKTVQALKEKAASIETALATVEKPSATLKSRCKSVQGRLESEFARIEKLRDDVKDLYSSRTALSKSNYELTKIKPEDRDRYARDAKAAYNAMQADMKQKKGSRKVGGLDKFEILRERYQGMPEYGKAYEQYLQTLRALQDKWTKMQAKEVKLREKMNAAKKKAAEESDEAELERVKKELAKEGEQIATVWFTPGTRNLKMLSTAVNKVKDAIRRAERDKPGKDRPDVPKMIAEYWVLIDAAHAKLCAGEYEEAERMLRDAELPKQIVRLTRFELPEEYKRPMTEQLTDMQAELRRCTQNLQRVQNRLEARERDFERAVNTLDTRLTDTLDQIAEEKARNEEKAKEEEE